MLLNEKRIFRQFNSTQELYDFLKANQKKFKVLGLKYAPRRRLKLNTVKKTKLFMLCLLASQITFLRNNTENLNNLLLFFNRGIL